MVSVAGGCGSQSGSGAGSDRPAAALLRSLHADDGYGTRYVLRGLGIRAYGQVQADGKRSRVVMKAANGNVVETRDDGAIFYLDPGGPSLHSVDANIPRNARWLKTEADPVRDRLNAGVRDFKILSPAQILEFVADLDPTVQAAGRERVNGVITTRYRVSITIDKLLGRLGNTAEDATTRAKLKDDDVRVVFWVDDHDLIRRSRVRQEHDHEAEIITADVTAYKRGLRVRLPHGRSVYSLTSRG